mmetsp:Transcript_12465/g.11301  ORF Transcript_12465/g.11301 Transcript_12465/m.11301 type:complete len:425 (-) Transcript_12465:134-1408(-)
MNTNYQISILSIVVLLSIVLILNVINQDHSSQTNHLTKVETTSRNLLDVPIQENSEEIVKTIENGMNVLFESIKSSKSVNRMDYTSLDTISAATATYYPKYINKFLNTTVYWPNLYTLGTSYNGSVVFFGVYPNVTGAPTGSYICYDYCKHISYLGSIVSRFGSNSDASRNYFTVGYALYRYIVDWYNLRGYIAINYFFSSGSQEKPIASATDSTGASVVVVTVSLTTPNIAYVYGSTDYGVTFTLFYNQTYNNKYTPSVRGIGYSFFGVIDNNVFISTKPTAISSGSSWTTITALSTIFGKIYYISDLTFGMTTSNLYVITTGSNFIYGSHDAGKTWAKTSYKAAWTSISTDFSGKYVYAVDKNKGLVYSKDFGSTFSNIFKATSSSPVYNVGVSYDGHYAYFYYNYNAYAYSSYKVTLYFDR